MNLDQLKNFVKETVMLNGIECPKSFIQGIAFGSGLLSGLSKQKSEEIYKYLIDKTQEFMPTLEDLKNEYTKSSKNQKFNNELN